MISLCTPSRSRSCKFFIADLIQVLRQLLLTSQGSQSPPPPCRRPPGVNSKSSGSIRPALDRSNTGGSLPTLCLRCGSGRRSRWSPKMSPLLSRLPNWLSSITFARPARPCPVPHDRRRQKTAKRGDIDGGESLREENHFQSIGAAVFGIRSWRGVAAERPPASTCDPSNMPIERHARPGRHNIRSLRQLERQPTQARRSPANLRQ